MSRDDAHSSLRSQILAEQNENKELKKQLESVKQQLADKDRDLVSARGDCETTPAVL
jgi:hypothetical protein